jgi:hypothetical protein
MSFHSLCHLNMCLFNLNTWQSPKHWVQGRSTLPEKIFQGNYKLIHTHTMPCPCRALWCESHMPCYAPVVLRQCGVLRENPRVAVRFRTANRETPCGGRKKLNGRCECTHTMPCQRRAVPWPWEVACKAARSEHGRGTAWYVWIRHCRTVLFKRERHNLNL